jgi:hypothetical protein
MSNADQDATLLEHALARAGVSAVEAIPSVDSNPGSRLVTALSSPAPPVGAVGVLAVSPFSNPSTVVSSPPPAVSDPLPSNALSKPPNSPGGQVTVWLTGAAVECEVLGAAVCVVTDVVAALDDGVGVGAGAAMIGAAVTTGAGSATPM